MRAPAPLRGLLEGLGLLGGLLVVLYVLGALLAASWGLK